MTGNPQPLEVENLSKTFGGHRALDGVSLTLSAGETLGLLGPNGAGKTTLVRSVAGRVRPDGGSLRILGLPPSHDAARSARGWVPQEIALYPLLSPRENLWTFGRYQGLAGAALTGAIGASLDWIGLPTAGTKDRQPLGRHARASTCRRHDPLASGPAAGRSRRWASIPSRASASTP